MINSKLNTIRKIYLVGNEPSVVAKKLPEFYNKLSDTSSFIMDYLNCIANYPLDHNLKTVYLTLSELKKVQGSSTTSLELIKCINQISLDQPQSSESITEYAEKNWFLADPEVLHEYENILKIKIELADIIRYAIYLISIKKTKIAISMIKNFGYTKEFISSYDIVGQLIDENSLDLLKFLADKDKDLISVYITQLCDKKKWKDAENFIENSNIDPLEFPLILKKATKRSLKFFLYNGVIIKNLMELVELDYIGIAGLIECLVEYGSNPSESWVLKVAEYLLRTNLPCVDIIKPSILDQLPRDQKVIFYPPEDEYGPYEKDCAGMPSSISVLFIDREEHLVELNWEDVKIVALDTEWKTELNKRINNKTSILQIGLPSKVLIIDLIKLSDSQELDNKLFELLGNSKIMKIGIGFDGDIARLKSSYKNMGCFKEPVYNYIDLIHVYKKEKNLNPGGLAGLSEIVLRVPMCKEEQKSNWELRPLRLSQIHYAALDVYICLAIYNEFFETDKIDMEKYSINIPSPHNKDNSVLLPSCNQCGSKIHSINQCKATQRCRFCGFADHSGFECPCFRY